MQTGFGWEENRKQIERLLAGRTLHGREEGLLDGSAADSLLAMRQGRWTAEAYTVRCLWQIWKWDKVLNAMISVNPEAIREAQACDELYRQGIRKPLLGLPVVVKDNIHVRGLPTTMGAAALRAGAAKRDAALIGLFREAGAVILGKSSLSEYASSGMTNNSLIGQTKNPYDLTRTPGGSSGGSGAAVAMHYAAAGIGTDGVNSIRSPASANCLTGLRPTKGSLPETGIAPSSKTQDMPGLLTRSARDAALFFDALCPAGARGAGREGTEKERGLFGRRIALLTNCCGEDPEVCRVISSVVLKLKTAGAQVIEWEDPVLDAERMLREDNVIRFEQKAGIDGWLSDPENGYPVKSLEEYLETGLVKPEVERALRLTLECGQTTAAGEYEKRLRQIRFDRRHVTERMKKQGVDALCYPSQRILAVRIGNRGGQEKRNGILASCLGFPAVSFPGGFSAPSETARDGVPVGMEWMGLPGTERKLLGMAESFEELYAVRKEPALLKQVNLEESL